MPVLALDYSPSTSLCDEPNALAIDLDEYCWALEMLALDESAELDYRG